MSSAITTPPAKISLPSTSKMSLHDRFTKLAKARPPTTKSAVSAVSSIPAVAGARASAKNRQLALQMANRPSVQAALKLKNKSIKQRLGQLKPTVIGQARPTKIYKPAASNVTNVRARLSLQKGKPVGAGRIDPARLSLPANPGANRFQGGERRGAGRGGANRRSLNNSLNSGNSNNAIRRVGAGGGMGNKEGRRSLRGRIGATNALNTNVRRYNRAGANVQRGRGRGRGGNRGGRRGNNRPQQQGRGGNAPADGQQQPPKSRENLDMDLDQYMAKSKSHLDSDLDVYMAQSGGQ